MSTMTGTMVTAASLTSQERATAIALVRQLEHDLFDEGPARPDLTGYAAVDRLNELRTSLGWLEVDPNGRWRWPE
jgi:hypothetical protein